MKCPTCKDVSLSMTDRNGVEIDYCPECRGVWLDRGELDKIIERSVSEKDTHYSDDKRYSKEYHSKESDYKYKKKKGFLGDLFDF